MPNAPERERMKTGVKGLDTILGGGLPKGRITLIEGKPGTGKTTLAFHYLRECARAGRRAVYITFMQSKEEIRSFAHSHGWTDEGIRIIEFPLQDLDDSPSHQSIFSVSEVNFAKMSNSLLDIIRNMRPEDLVIDSISEFSAFMDSSRAMQRDVLKLKLELWRMGCTSILTAGDFGEALAPLRTLAHGAIELKMIPRDFGRPIRRISVNKMRETAYLEGNHDFRIVTGGLEVYPRIQVPPGSNHSDREAVSSGMPELDRLLGGGLQEGTTCMVAGTTGAGKSTLISLYVRAASQRGHKTVMFCFDESPDLFVKRTTGIGIPISRYIEDGLLDLRALSVGEISAIEFFNRVKKAVELEQARLIVIDSLSGFVNAMTGETGLNPQLHDLLSCLRKLNVLTFITVTYSGFHPHFEHEVEASYLADAIILVRHFEAQGELRRCLSVIKKRYGAHEKSIREMNISSDGIQVGSVLTDFEGILGGMPRYVGSRNRLI